MRFSWGLLALVVILPACGGKDPNRMTLQTPGANTGHPMTSFPFANPTPEATPTPSPTPKPDRGPVTRDEKSVIRGWSEELRHGHVDAASRYFRIPSIVSSTGVDAATLASRADVKEFNDAFPCGAKLEKVRRSVDHYVIGTFTLTERPGKTCDGPGNLAEVAFLIHRHHIERWVRAPDPEPEPTPTPKPVQPDTT
jgi:hypothetical protein